MSAAEDIEGVQEHHEVGHLVQYSVKVSNFAGNVPFNLERSFEFLCGVSPTSWSFCVAFRRMPREDSITIRRNDKGAKLMDVEFWMKPFSDPLMDIPPTRFKVSRFPNNRGLTKDLKRVVPAEVMALLGERHVRVQISFGVRGCHQEKDLKTKVVWRESGDESHRPTVLCSKM